MYLTQKGQTWYLEHRLSPKQAEALDKSKLSRSLRTDSKREARRLAVPVELEWQRQIADAMDESTDAYDRQLREWRRVIQSAPTEDEREVAEGLLRDELEDQLHAAAKRAGIHEDDEASLQDLPEYAHTFDVYQRATGRKVELAEYMEDYFARLDVGAKTADQHRAAIRRLAEYTPFVSDVTLSTVQGYFDDRASAGISRATLQRELSGMRGYWKWLSRRLDIIDRERDPFNVDIATQSKKRDTGRKAYSSAEAVRLLRAAVDKPDPKLADLIRLGMFTGARLEELCVMNADDVQLDNGVLTIRDAKTLAGIRDVPIHPRLRPVVERLKRDTGDGYLIPGLKRDKYGKRSPAIGKRFGHLKRDNNFSTRHVFHSFRNTLKTQLRNAGVPLDVQNEMLGHEQDDEMLGVYYDPTLADGRDSWREIQAEAMARVRYPELEDEDMP